jgi:hypothetical protein
VIHRWTPRGNHEGLALIGEAGDVAADKAGRIGVNDQFTLGNGALLAGLLDDHGNVITDHFGEAGRVDRDNIRFVDREDIVQGRLQVGESAEDGSAFREGTRGGHDRFLVVTGEVTAVISAAAL